MHAEYTEQQAAALETVLNDLTGAHAELLELVRDHRRAISRGDAAAIQECLSRQGIIAVRVSDLESSRRDIVGAMTGRPRATVTELMTGLGGEWGGRIAESAARLRAVLAAIQRESGIVRSATQTLMAHIDALMRQVAQALNHAGTYGRQGRMDSAGPVPCGIDMVH